MHDLRAVDHARTLPALGSHCTLEHDSSRIARVITMVGAEEHKDDGFVVPAFETGLGPHCFLAAEVAVRACVCKCMYI